MREPGLSHLAFFQRLGEIGESDPPAWRAHSAGLLTLRLVDRWLARRGRHRGPTLREIAQIKRAISRIDDERIGLVLLPLADIVSGAESSQDTLAALLIAYGMVLEALSEPSLAADVYETAVKYTYAPQAEALT